MEKVSLLELFHRKDCYGWAWKCKGRRHHYCWQNDNDLGLSAEIDECTVPETVLRKVKLAPGKYIYILRNNWGIFGEDAVTEPQMVAAIKNCHLCQFKLTAHEKMLSKRVFGF